MPLHFRQVTPLSKEQYLKLLVDLGNALTNGGYIVEKEKLLTLWLCVLKEQPVPPGGWTEEDVRTWAKKFGLATESISTKRRTRAPNPGTS